MFPFLPRIKVCCIASEDEARLAIRLGASALGLVSRMPSGPGPIPENRIRDIASTVPPGVATFLLTCETTADAIIAQQRGCRTNTLQLVDEVEPGTYGALRRALPGISIVQVVHVRDESAVGTSRNVARGVDAILLDSGNPSAAIKELGGTGRAHDWAISRRIRDAVSVPVYLAGGLTSSNVGQAIDLVQPFGVDACSGLRTDGRLDPTKLRRFVDAVRETRQG
ncbi:MAG: phosphoribosylanthranilate isomerase [Gemmatimonadaceae bacterium]